MTRLILISLLLNCSQLFAQQQNLVNLLNAKRLIPYSGVQSIVTPDSDRPAISSSGLVLLKGLSFKNGLIEIDLRGKDILQQSFLGVAFNVKDSLHYEVVYFRPFNFNATDTMRRKHAIQYMSMPDHPWSILRKDYPDQYESRLGIDQDAKVWFHASLSISNDSVVVYVNQSKYPALKIKRLQGSKSAQIALWSDGLAGDFANLELKAGK